MLVGRAPELAALTRLDPDRPLALVGEAGIGKTTLLRAATAQARRRTYEGGGLASLDWMSYLPVVRALGAEPPPGDPAAVAAWAAERVDGGILVLDDLHWADAETLALLPLLAGRVRVLAGIRRGDPGTPRAEAQAHAAGFELVELAGLPDEDAAALVRRRRPDLEPADVALIVERAGGNALLLEELALAGDRRESLRLAFGARLRRCSPEAQEAMATLGLLGRPAARRLLPDAVDELLEAGLVTNGDEFAPRHALLAEAATDELDPETRRRLHARLAWAVSDPGEAARHHQAAGELDAGLREALVAAAAAERPGERARHLAVAAACASGPEADELRLEAAEALVAAGEPEPALGLAERVVRDDPETRARAALVRARARFWLGDMDAHREAIADGLALVAGSGSPTEVRLRIEESRLPLWDRHRSHIADAQDVFELATAAGVEVTQARILLGIAYYVDRDDRCVEHLRAGLEQALAEGDHERVCEAAEFVFAALQSSGDPDAARAEAARTETWCRERGLLSKELLFRWLRARVTGLSAGPSDAIAADLESVVHHPGVGARAEQVAADLAFTLIDLGRLTDADGLLRATTSVTPTGRIPLAIAGAELEWAAGRPAAALAALDEFKLDPPPERWDDWMSVLAVIAGWASLDLGLQPPTGRPHLSWRLAAGFGPELEALASAGDPARARATARLFDEAASLHAGQVLREEVRCAWGAADALRRGGRLADARTRLLDAEARAEAHGLRPLLNRIRRSLRQVGVPRTEPRAGARGRMTAREREVLALVGEGYSSTAIARRLGLSRATVESQIRSAMTKLGARTRIQAASLAAESER